jgi:hypothetical protein
MRSMHKRPSATGTRDTTGRHRRISETASPSKLGYGGCMYMVVFALALMTYFIVAGMLSRYM